MKRAMARQAEAEREKRAKIIAAEGEALAADALGTAANLTPSPLAADTALTETVPNGKPVPSTTA
jgi:regulator of protease activity HflC (stomatin/prohibitin superfamily)